MAWLSSSLCVSRRITALTGEWCEWWWEGHGMVIVIACRNAQLEGGSSKGAARTWHRRCCAHCNAVIWRDSVVKRPLGSSTTREGEEVVGGRVRRAVGLVDSWEGREWIRSRRSRGATVVFVTRAAPHWRRRHDREGASSAPTEGGGGNGAARRGRRNALASTPWHGGRSLVLCRSADWGVVRVVVAGARHGRRRHCCARRTATESTL